MTVSQLIDELKKLPQDAKVTREGGEYKNDVRPINSVKYIAQTSLAFSGNTVILS
jgi:hypothetical protein